VLTIGPSVHDQGAVPERDRRCGARPSAVNHRGQTRWCWWCTRTCGKPTQVAARLYQGASRQLTFCQQRPRSAGHLAVRCSRRWRTPTCHIPYRSTRGDRRLMGGRVSMIWLSSVGNLGSSGMVRPIAVSLAGERWSCFRTCRPSTKWPQGLRSTTWVSMYLPKGAPPDVTEKLTAAVNAALADPSRRSLSTRSHRQPRATGPKFLEKYLKDGNRKVGAISCAHQGTPTSDHRARRATQFAG